MPKEIVIPHELINDNKTITQNMENIFKANDLNIHTNEVVNLEDDYKKKVRKISVKNTKYFFVNNTWKK